MTDSMEVLGWTLVHFCWQATAIALLYRIVDIALRRSRSDVRYALALIALMSMLGAAFVTLAYEGLQVAHRAESPAGALGDFQAEIRSDLAMVQAAGVAAVSQSGEHFSWMDLLVRAMPWLDAMWLAGVLVLSIRTAGGWYVIRRLRGNGIVAVPAEIGEMFVRLCGRVGVRKKIDLYISERISGPLAMGVLRSVILLPVSALTHLSPGQLEVVLAHELAHIRRGDYVWNMVQTVVETLFFFHPAVWWVSNSLRQQRELCCDDAALAYCADPIVYATALLCLEEQRGSKLRLAMALDGHQSGLKIRIVRILGEAPERRRQIAPLSLVGICAMVGLFALPLPRLFADHVVVAAKRVEAAVIAPRTTHISGQEAPAAASKSADPVSPLPAGNPARAAQAAPAISPQQEISPVAVGHVRAAALPASAVAPAVVISPQPASNPTAVEAPRAVISTSIAEPISAARVVVSARLSEALTAPHTMAMFMQQSTEKASSKSDYISEMRAAGYGDDLDKLIEMKIQHITPEYARSMQQLGYGKPTAQELVQLKIFGVTPEEVKALTASGMKPASLHDLISYRIFKVTPEFVAGMKAAGFSDIPPSKLVELRVHGITPEFAKTAKAQYPDITLDQLVQLRIFHIDEAFIAAAKRHGFTQLTIDKLVRLRISGLLDDDSDQKAEKN